MCVLTNIAKSQIWLKDKPKLIVFLYATSHIQNRWQQYEKTLSKFYYYICIYYIYGLIQK